jgi:hypothetical protein
MKNSIRKTYSLVSLVGTVTTLYVMLMSFKTILDIDMPLFKMIGLFVYIPIFISTVVLIIKGLNTVFNEGDLFIGNLFKFKVDKETEKKITKNTYIIGTLMLCVFFIGLGLIIFANLSIIVPSVTLISLKILSISFMINTFFIYIFGMYRLIME